MNKKAITIIYSLIFIVSLLFFLILKFPLDAIVGHYLASVEKITQGKFRIMHSKREINFLFDSRFYDFQILQKKGSAYEEIFFSPKIDIGFSLFSLISGQYNVDFFAEFPATAKNQKDAFLEGEINLASDRLGVALEVENLPFQQLAFFQQNLPKMLRGKMTGTLRFVGPVNLNLARTSADFRLKIYDFESLRTPYQDFGIKLPQPLQEQLGGDYLPAFSFSKKDQPAYFEVIMNQGRINLQKFILDGQNVTLNLSGRLRALSANSISGTLNGKLLLSEDLQKTITLLQIFAEEKDQEGFYPLSVKGNIFNVASYNIGKTNLGQFLPAP